MPVLSIPRARDIACSEGRDERSVQRRTGDLMGSLLAMDEDDGLSKSSSTSLGDVPADLLARIFAYLPIHSIVQLRCVCKLWNSIVSSWSSFPSLWSKHPPSHLPWIIMYSSRDSIAAFDPSSCHWRTVPLPFPPGFSPDKRLLASSSGLLCFCLTCESFRLLLICNPITRDYKMLPELPLVGDNFLITMDVDETSSSYKIYVADSMDEDTAVDGGPRAVFYSSVDDSWHPLAFRDFCSPFMEGCHRDRNVLHLGTFFSLSEAGPPHQLTTFNTVAQEITSLTLPFERSMSLSPPLSVRHGRLFLAGCVWEHLPFSSFNIWELDPSSMKFVQVESTPCAALDDIYIAPLPLTTIERFGNGECLFFHARVLRCPVMYDLVEKAWLCMPRYYGPCEGPVPSIVYEPSFSAKV